MLLSMLIKYVIQLCFLIFILKFYYLLSVALGLHCFVRSFSWWGECACSSLWCLGFSLTPTGLLLCRAQATGVWVQWLCFWAHSCGCSGVLSCSKGMGNFPDQSQNHVSLHWQWILIHCTTRKSLTLSFYFYKFKSSHGSHYISIGHLV